MGQTAKQSRLLDDGNHGQQNAMVVDAVASRSALRDFFGSKDFWFAAALVVAVFLVYQPAWHGGYLFDDDFHLLNNPVLKPGGLAKIWTPGSYISYWPLTFTVYWVEFHLWGLRPLGFHLVNLAVHALSALLVWQVLGRLRVPGAMLAAALFALHPVNVESVAWIAQLKGVLSLALALVSVLFYLDHEECGGRWRYGLALATYLLSALAKGTALTLPIVLLACAWWQRDRIVGRDLLRVLPYILIGAVMAAFEVWTQHTVAGTDIVRTDGFYSRAAVAGWAPWFYLGKLLWPLDLCLNYPRWTIDERSVLSYLPGLLWVALLVWAWRQQGAWGRPVVMLIVCFTALLLPALGFVNIYFMRYSLVADHWQYIATIVPCAVLAGITAKLTGWYWSRPAALVASVALLALLAVLSWRQNRMYADAETLYRTTIDRNPNCWLAYNNLGLALARRGQVAAAIAQYQRALELMPDYTEAHDNLGNALAGRGQLDEAITQYRRALTINPESAEARNNLGLALAGRGQLEAAIAQYQQTLKIKPDYAEAHNNLGIALADRGQLDTAVAQYQQSLKIKPDYVEAHNNLGNALASLGQFDAAVAHFRKALELKPDYAEAHNNFGLALAGRGQLEAAIDQYQKALEIEPDYAEAHYDLGNALAARGQVDAAIDQYRKALKLKPDYSEAHNNLGVVLAGRGRVEEAIAHFKRALELNPNNAGARKNLAAVLAGRALGQ